MVFAVLEQGLDGVDDLMINRIVSLLYPDNRSDAQRQEHLKKVGWDFLHNVEFVLVLIEVDEIGLVAEERVEVFRYDLICAEMVVSHPTYFVWGLRFGHLNRELVQ